MAIAPRRPAAPRRDAQFRAATCPRRPAHLYCDASPPAACSDASRRRPCTRCKPATSATGRARRVYLHGAVGTGKSLLMELAHRAGGGAARPRRQHRHELMIDVHAGYTLLQQARPRRVVLTEQGQRVFKYDDADDDVDAAPLDAVVRAIAAETQLLCLDEVQVTDVADALVLRSYLRSSSPRRPLRLHVQPRARGAVRPRPQPPVLSSSSSS